MYQGDWQGSKWLVFLHPVNQYGCIRVTGRGVSDRCFYTQSTNMAVSGWLWQGKGWWKLLENFLAQVGRAGLEVLQFMPFSNSVKLQNCIITQMKHCESWSTDERAVQIRSKKRSSLYPFLSNLCNFQIQNRCNSDNDTIFKQVCTGTFWVPDPKWISPTDQQ